MCCVMLLYAMLHFAVLCYAELNKTGLEPLFYAYYELRFSCGVLLLCCVIFVVVLLKLHDVKLFGQILFFVRTRVKCIKWENFWVRCILHCSEGG